ncbi:HPP family protein [Ensifer sp. 22564]|uniref:HPP family protein n=1 Tax=unclassified Ensifer TaxID=2633371 RepID=UPI000AFD1798
MRHFFSRHQPPVHINRGLIAGIGGLVAIAAVGALTNLVGHPMLMAPFGASCVLIFSAVRRRWPRPCSAISPRGSARTSSTRCATRKILSKR